MRIAQASSDERGQYHGGAAGDQTGRELNIREWYSRPWDTVLRAKNRAVAERIASAMEKAVANPMIGYDQYQRTTLYTAAQKVAFDFSRITAPVECDCSSLVAAAVNAAGIAVSPGLWTGVMTSALLATGQFECLRDSKYLLSPDFLLRGDILLNTVHHTAVALDNGAAVNASFTPYWVMTTVSSCLQVRTGPGKHYAEFMISDGSGGWTTWRYPPNAQIRIVAEANGWGRVGDTSGWISLAWCRKI